MSATAVVVSCSQYFYAFYYDKEPDATTKNRCFDTKEEALDRCDACLMADIRSIYGLNADTTVNLTGGKMWSYQRKEKDGTIRVRLQTNIGWGKSVKIVELKKKLGDEGNQ